MYRRPEPLGLSPARDVVVEGGMFRALTREPWLKVQDTTPFRARRIVEVRYCVDLLEPSCRPVIRFLGKDGAYRDVIMPAAVEGTGIWQGRVPPDTTEVWISPVNREGPFSFRLIDVRELSLAARLARAKASPKRSFFARSARWVGLHTEADLNLRWVFGRALEQDLEDWRGMRSNSIVHVAAPDMPVTIVLRAGDASIEQIAATYRSLVDQGLGDWRFALITSRADVVDWIEHANDTRISRSDDVETSDISTDRWICCLAPGDRLASMALAAFASAVARNPRHAIIYADEVAVTDDGKQIPVFKPDWSSILQKGAPYIGRAAILRADVWRACIASPDESPDAAIAAAAANLSSHEVGHVRRLLLTRRVETTATPVERPRVVFPPADKILSVGIVIPTRDRIDLLEPCLESVLGNTSGRDIRVLVVDNDSAEAKTHETLARLKARDARLDILACPGPFNFSALCNRGADALASDLLLFLNNDTVVLDSNWIESLASLAVLPDVGAVGAKLLYPDRRVQHAGVVLGMGGVAGHFGDGLPPDAPGWLGRNLVAHETSAVTGACLMVERSKFVAVGGFDAENLPIELNDIDLCLRLAERGWKTVCDNRTTLLHHQSASRGGPGLRLQRVYARERDYFIETWRHVIRDDPYFNPALSLYDYEPALG
jgi:GT2 family glycosyltransferase